MTIDKNSSFLKKENTTESGKKAVFKNVGLQYHNDGNIIIPKDMSHEEAVAWIKRIQEEQEAWTTFSVDAKAFLLDGARALAVAINRFAGFLATVPTPGFFGDKLPTMVSFPIDHLGNSVSVPWGRIEVPGIQGYFETSYTIKEGHVLFAVSGKCQKKDLPKIDKIMELMQEEIRENSVYRGKAFTVNVNFDPKKPTENAPTFIDHTKRQEGTLFFNPETQQALDTSLFGPIKFADNCETLGISLKRGVLLYGIYGVGKSELAALVANIAVANGYTFIHLTDPHNLVNAYALAKNFPRSVIFCEDIDKVTSGKRDANMDELLNCMDGILSKKESIMTVFTTNNVETMHPAFMRPGRLDDVIEIPLPNAEICTKLVQLFAGESLDPESNLDLIGKTLKGQVPALIKEVVERCRLAGMVRTRSTKFLINHEDVVTASAAMKTHRQFIMGRQKPLPKSLAEKIGAGALGAVFKETAKIEIDGHVYTLESVKNGVKNKYSIDEIEEEEVERLL